MALPICSYTRAEQPIRISAWYAFNGESKRVIFTLACCFANVASVIVITGVGVAMGGLLGYAIGTIKGALVSWKYEFLVIGAICSAWAICLLLFLPSSPATTWWLTRDERLMAVARLRGNQVRPAESAACLVAVADGSSFLTLQTGIENRTFKMDQMKEAFADIKTWLFFFIGVTGNIPCVLPKMPQGL